MFAAVNGKNTPCASFERSLSQQGVLPCWALVTDGDTDDPRIAQKLEFAAGTMVVDRGYRDYALHERWTKAGLYLVTRSRSNLVYEALEKREVGSRGNIKRDEIIQLTSEHAQERCPSRLRQVVIEDGEHQSELVFLTNVFHLAASTIVAIYKDRCQCGLTC